MLQIISGKFFTGLEKNEHNGKGILFSNCNWFSPIKTNIGVLEPVDYSGDITGFIFNYKNQIENDGFLVRCGDDEIVEQFKLICSFGLKSYFSEYREQVLKVCSSIKRKNSRTYPAVQFIKSTVELHKRLDSENIKRFIQITNKVISLERKSYERVINALRCILDSIEVLEYNFDLAYSMLIYCLESLNQGEEYPKSTWDDWDQNSKPELDSILSSIPLDKAESLKQILLKDKHFKLQQGYIDFVKKHLYDSFFINESESIQLPLRKSQLERALINSYQMRSGYVHSLQSVQDQIRHSTFATHDVFTFQNNPYLTYGGLYRLVNHVVENFIYSLSSVDKEAFNYRAALPGKMTVEFAPQYWIWRAESFNAKQANTRLSALIGELESSPTITDLSQVMEKIKAIFQQSPSEQRPPLLYLFWLYNIVLREDLQTKGWDKFVSKHEIYFREHRIENLAVWVVASSHIGGIQIPWNIHGWIRVYKGYAKSKYKQNSLSLPALSESAILCAIANLAWKAGYGNEYNWLLNTAITELSGKTAIQGYIYSCMVSYKDVDLHKILNWFKN